MQLISSSPPSLISSGFVSMVICKGGGAAPAKYNKIVDYLALLVAVLLSHRFTFLDVDVDFIALAAAEYANGHAHVGTGHLVVHPDQRQSIVVDDYFGEGCPVNVLGRKLSYLLVRILFSNKSIAN